MSTRDRPTRLDAVQIAASVVEEVEARLNARRSLAILPTAQPLTPVGALANRLAQRLADELQGDSEGPGAGGLAKSWLRQGLEARKVFGSHAANGATATHVRGARPMLLVARQRSHLLTLKPVARLARAHGFEPHWLAFRRDHQLQLLAAGEIVVPAPNGWDFGWRPAWLASALPIALGVEAWSPARGIEAKTWRRLCNVIARETIQQLPSVLTAARALERSLEVIRPRLVLVGNACTLEGSLATIMAHARGLRVACVQHGEIGPAQVEWAASGVDLLCAWGEVSKRQLQTLGVSARKIAITGAPARRPNPPGRQERPKATRPKVMVALSGAGHAVHVTEHREQVRRLLGAAQETPEIDWIFRLHPKDDPGIYRGLLAPRPQPHPQIVEARGAPDMGAALKDIDLLVTVTSTSAVDAMEQGIPVMTLDRSESEQVPVFVSAGATYRVARLQPIAQAVRNWFSQPPDPAVAQKVATFLRGYLADTGEGAAERVVRELEALLECYPRQ